MKTQELHYWSGRVDYGKLGKVECHGFQRIRNGQCVGYRFTAVGLVSGTEIDRVYGIKELSKYCDRVNYVKQQGEYFERFDHDNKDTSPLNRPLLADEPCATSAKPRRSRAGAA